MDKLNQFVEKWKKLDKRTKIIYGIIAVILVIGLIISLSSGDDAKTADDDINIGVSDDFTVLDDVSDTDTDGEGYDAAMSSTDADAGGEDEAPTVGAKVVYGEDYNTRDEVAAYLANFGELPPNYITKSEARDWGWQDEYDTVAEAAPGMSIGGDKFGNREGLLPKKSGRQYYECDIDYVRGGRNAKRIVYSNDGLIFYTDDHYESFVQYDTETGTWK